MTPGLTADDLRLISRFVDTPPHRRRPDVLGPDTVDRTAGRGWGGDEDD